MRLHQLVRLCLMSFSISFASQSFSQVTSQTSSDANIVDNIISDNVTKAIGKTESLSDIKLQVLTSDGIVHLSGTVKSKEEADTVIKIAQKESAIPTVDSSKLKIEDEDANTTAQNTTVQD